MFRHGACSSECLGTRVPWPPEPGEGGREAAVSMSARLCPRGEMKPVVVAVGRHRLGNRWRVAAGRVLCVMSRQRTSQQPGIRLG